MELFALLVGGQGATGQLQGKGSSEPCWLALHCSSLALWRHRGMLASGKEHHRAQALTGASLVLEGTTTPDKAAQLPMQGLRNPSTS